MHSNNEEDSTNCWLWEFVIATFRNWPLLPHQSSQRRSAIIGELVLLCLICFNQLACANDINIGIDIDIVIGNGIDWYWYWDCQFYIDIDIEIDIDLCEFNKNLVPGFPAAERCLKELINVAKIRKYNLVLFDRYDDTNFYI